MKVLLIKEKNIDIDLKQISEKLNQVCKTVVFESSDEELIFPNAKLKKREPVPKNVMALFEIMEPTLTVLISEKQFKDNFFYHEIQDNILLLSFYQWEDLTSFSKNIGLAYFIADFLSLDIDNSERHHEDDETQCIYNFAWDKREIDDGIKSAIMCDKCQERMIGLENPQKQKLLDDIINILEELRNANKVGNDIVEYWHNTKKEKVKLFFSYAHDDREYLNEFKDYIKIFERNGLVERWDDNELIVGEKWDNTIKDKIYSADIIILLLSASSLASDYIYNNELKIAFELNEIDEAHVIPIIIKDCLWDMTEFKDFQTLPRDGKAVNSWKLREEAWTATARGLKKAIDSIISAKQQSIKSIQDNQKNSKLGNVIESVKQTDTNKEIVLKFLKTYHRWWFNIPRIINWGSEREGFARLKSLSHEELKSILSELERENKVISKPSSKNKNSLLYKAK